MSCDGCPDVRGSLPLVEYLGWRAFYDDGSVYCSRGDKWEDLPDDGVLMVMVYNRDRETGQLRRRAVQASYYFLVEQPGRPPIIGQSEHSPDQIRSRYPQASVKTGRLTDEENWSRVERAAFDSSW